MVQTKSPEKRPITKTYRFKFKSDAVYWQPETGTLDLSFDCSSDEEAYQMLRDVCDRFGLEDHQRIAVADQIQEFVLVDLLLEHRVK